MLDYIVNYQRNKSNLDNQKPAKWTLHVQFYEKWKPIQ